MGSYLVKVIPPSQRAITQGKAFANMLRILQLVNYCHAESSKEILLSPFAFVSS